MNAVTELTDTEQDRMCEICEEDIIGHSRKTRNYLCEGAYCERAYELLVEENDNNKIKL